MRKGWWIALSVVLAAINISLVLKIKNPMRNPIIGDRTILRLDKGVLLPSKESVLTLIVYFSSSSCGTCMEESYYWNKLFKDLEREELFIIGFIPEGEDLKTIKNKIFFPVAKDKGRKIEKRFNIKIIPYKIVMDRHGNILYMSPSFSGKESQESFYLEVLELLTKLRIKESMISKNQIQINN